MTPSTHARLLGLAIGASLTLASGVAHGQSLEQLTRSLPSPMWTTLGLAALALAPFLFVVSTSFAKIAVVLAILRSALGVPTLPPNLVLTAVALVLTLFVMAPVAQGTLGEVEAVLGERPPESVSEAITTAQAAAEPWRRFLAANSGRAEVALFVELSDSEPVDDAASVPLLIALPSFALTELAEAFQIGFLLFLPFLVLDLLVGSVLLSLGMHMLTPTTVALPFKLLLFVVVDGWALLSRSLVLGYLPG